MINNTSQLLSTGENIIRVSGTTKTTYLGYDIFDESLIEVEKEQCSSIPNCVIKLLSSQSNRIQLALVLKNGIPSHAESLLDIGERTIRRHIADKDGPGSFRKKGEKIKKKILVDQINK
jgi:hypothetical protein